jgi:glycolate oxidase FAD binding subunit
VTSDRTALESLVGPGAVRDPDPLTDRISSILPPLVVEPSTPAPVAAVLEWASQQRRTVVIRGAGTRMGWGRIPSDVDVLLSTRGLNRIIAHAHGDLTATVEAGVPLATLNEALAVHGQCLPLDPLGRAGATLGGLLATNESGPLRHRYGTPRDMVIGIEIATPGGTIAKAGGRVVKNVAGYDLSKLMTGSFGSLAAIVSATFKLAPVARESATVRVEATDDRDLAQLVHDLMLSQFDLAACEIAVGFGAAGDAGVESHSLLLKCTALSSPVAAQVADVVELCGGGRSVVLSDSDANDAWTGHASLSMRSHIADHGTAGEAGGRTVRGPGTPAIVRVSWMPADLVRALSELRDSLQGLPARLTGRAALGAGLVALGGSPTEQAEASARLRMSAAFGNVVLVAGSTPLKERVDVWGPSPAAAALIATLKQAFDPAGILNAGRGPV